MHRVDIYSAVEELYRLDLDELRGRASDMCRQRFGGSVYLRGLIEFSSYCVMDCHYCGIRKSNSSTGRYRMEEDEILSVRSGAASYADTGPLSFRAVKTLSTL